jgi:hypothetical protein
VWRAGPSRRYAGRPAFRPWWLLGVDVTLGGMDVWDAFIDGAKKGEFDF